MDKMLDSDSCGLLLHFRFDQEGFMPTPEKVQAIYECEPPMSKSEVISFLGIAGYQSMFIPRYASLPKPLQDFKKIIKTAHTLGHLGMTKTNQILRRKCCFPGMNLLNSQIRGSGSCFDCPLRTKDKSSLSHQLFLKKHGNISVLISEDLTPMVI